MALFVFVLALLQTSVLPYFEVFGVQPALVMVAVVILATTHADSRALRWGFGGGLAVDLFSAAPIGTNALLFTLLAFAAGLGGRGLDRTLVYYPALLLALQVQQFPIDWSAQLSTRLLPAVAVNLLAGLVLYPFVRQLEKWTRAAPVPRFKGIQ